jgi:hypothetical protein
MIERVTLDVIEVQQTLGDLFGICENLPSLRNELSITVVDPVPDTWAFGIIRKVVEFRSPKIVSSTILVHDPENFPIVLDQVSRKLHADNQVYRLSV